MNLKNSFFTIDGKSVAEGVIRYDLSLNSGHIIYEAHFPERKVTPGVCLLQVAEELLEEHLQRELEIVAVKNIKFLSVVSPDETPHLIYLFTLIQSDEGKVCAQASVEAEERVFAKLSFTTLYK